MLCPALFSRRFALALSLALASIGCSSSDGGGGGPAGTGGSASAGAAGSGGVATGGTGGGGAGAAGSGGVGGTAGNAGAAGAAGSPGTGGATGGTCPPAPPFGSNVGDIAPDVTLYDCNGTPVQLHSLCAHQAAAVYTFAIWCPVCKAHMENGEPQALYAQYQNDDFDMFVVVTQTATGSLPDESHCIATRDAYNLKMPVLFDKDGALSGSLGLAVNSGALALSQGARIELKQSYGLDALTQKVPELLGK